MRDRTYVYEEKVLGLFSGVYQATDRQGNKKLVSRNWYICESCSTLCDHGQWTYTKRLYNPDGSRIWEIDNRQKP